MSAKFFWFAPTNGDSEFIGKKKQEQEPSLAYLTKVAQTAEEAGFEGILIPTGTPYLDAWLVGSAIVHHTTKITPLVAFRPGFIAPPLAAKMASTLDQLSKGRLAVNVVSGGSPCELAQDGDFLSHDERYERADEFLEVVKKLWNEENVNHKGNYFSVENGELKPSNYEKRQIPLFFGGSSEAALEVAARHADVYLQWGEPVDHVRKQIMDLNQRAAKYGRTLQHGVRIHIIVRDTEEDAWQEVERLAKNIDTEVEERVGTYYKDADSVAQKRMNDLLNGDYRFDRYKWAGIGRVRKGAGTAIVGSPEQVIESLQEYMDAGVSTFVLSGFPHDREAERVGKLVLPHFQKQGQDLQTI